MVGELGGKSYRHFPACVSAEHPAALCHIGGGALWVEMKRRGSLAAAGGFMHLGQGKVVSVSSLLLPPLPSPTLHIHILAFWGLMLGANMEAWPMEVTDQGQAGTGR